MIGLDELNRVLFLISWWLTAIKTHNSIGLFDINKMAESLALKLLNEIYGYNLDNLNYDQNNYPGIDLGDKTNKIGFQISSRRDTRKFQECLEKFSRGPNKTYYNGILFLILSQEKKPQLSKEKYRKIYPDFSPGQHILNADDLIREIRRIYNTDKEKFYKIKNILEDEISLLHINIKNSQKKSTRAKYPKGSFLWVNLPKEEQLPHELTPDPYFIGRDEEKGELNNKLRPNNVLSIIGPPMVGKSELFKVYLNKTLIAGNKDKSFPFPLSLIYLTPNEKYGDSCVLRSLSDALEVYYESDDKSMDNLFIDGRIFEYDEDENFGSDAEILFSDLCSIIHRKSLIAVIEDCHILKNYKDAQKTVERLLTLEFFKQGTAILISRDIDLPIVSEKRFYSEPLKVECLNPSDALMLLKNIGINEKIANEAVEILMGMDEAFYPMVMKRGAFNFLDSASKDKDKITGEFLADCIFKSIGHNIEDILIQTKCNKIIIEGGTAGPLAYLMSFSLLCNSRITKELLQKLELSSTVGIALKLLGWIVEENAYEYFFEISKRKLRTMLIDYLNQMDKKEINHIIKNTAIELIDVFKKNVNIIDETILKRWFDNALAILDKSIQKKNSLWYRLYNELIPLSSSDTVFPISTERHKQIKDESKDLEIDSLLDILSDLTICVRDKNKDGKFIEKFSKTIDLYIRRETIEGYELGKIDKIGFLGKKYIRDKNKILKLRIKLLEHLNKYPDDVSTISPEFIKWKISWILNTVELKIRLEDFNREEVKKKIFDCQKKLEDYKIAVPEDIISYFWLKSRLSLLESRFIFDKNSRIDKIRNGFNDVLKLYILTDGESKWLSFLFRICRYQIIEEKDDNKREEVLDIIYQFINLYLGDIKNWPISISAKFASLYRLSSRCMISQQKSLDHIDYAIEILSNIEKILRKFIEITDNRPLIALAKCIFSKYKIYEDSKRDVIKINTLNEARKLCQYIISKCPTPSAWELALDLWKPDYSKILYYRFGYQIKETELSDFTDVIVKCREWVKKSNYYDHSVANLLVLCNQKEWSIHGKIESEARNYYSNKMGKDWKTSPKSEKLQLIKSIFRKRSSFLSRIKYQFEPSINMFLAELINLEQYQYSTARYTNRILNVELIEKLFEEYLSIWPQHPTILESMGKFYRYIWNYPKAIQFFDQVVKITSDVFQRREVSVILAECLLSAAIHFNNTEFYRNRTKSKKELLIQAKNLLESLEGNKIAAVKAAIIKDRVVFELGEYIDWNNLENTYDVVFGGPERYVETVMKGISENYFEYDKEFPKTLAEAVIKNFTNEEVLSHMGSLFLRRAEIGKSDSPVHDCERAYSIFNACRVLYTSFSESDLGTFKGSEPALNKFKRAKAIHIAAELTKTLNPFQANPKPKKSLLELANSLMHSARENSIGRFYKLIKEKILEIKTLTRELRG
jgi:hypothetical protein